MTRNGKRPGPEPVKLLQELSTLGDPWVPVCSAAVDFSSCHFETAMANLIRQPNINSTVIMRADILRENVYDPEGVYTTVVSKLAQKKPQFDQASPGSEAVLTQYPDDFEIRHAPLHQCKLLLAPKSEIVRRIIPRNPFKDHVINQTCLTMTSTDPRLGSVLVCYIPHIKNSLETPYYLPPVWAVGILYHQNVVSVLYLPFKYTDPQSSSLLRALDPADRTIRIALRLLETSVKHSNGARSGYEKRVLHDTVVPKIEFQNRYISLKKRYSSSLVNSWCESTDPNKHVFEDIAIAAFLIELWRARYTGPDSFEFRDLGCGNGLLVYILILEGYVGKGIDARKRKSWATYPPSVQENLVEQIIIPGVLLQPQPAVSGNLPDSIGNKSVIVYRSGLVQEKGESLEHESLELQTGTKISYGYLLEPSRICTTNDFPKNTFIIGNHSDELTCWVPLLQFPFMVIPCCSHALSGARVRYTPQKKEGVSTNISTYGALVDHVEKLAQQMGWIVEKEMLRIPSTRNAAIISTLRQPKVRFESDKLQKLRTLDIIASQGGAEGWVENSLALLKKPPRNH